MEYGSIHREIYVEASPEVVYDVISSPEHMTEWFPDELTLDPTGRVGEFCWGDRNAPDVHLAAFTIVEAKPPSRFAFRWVYPDGEAASPTNSLLATFELIPQGDGTLVRLTETGFREKGWEVAVLEQEYAGHCEGWDTHLPRLRAYVARLVATE